jgi:alkylhydroperoxidase/carboxymuconolactone decarboxylase family protein YurZ
MRLGIDEAGVAAALLLPAFDGASSPDGRGSAQGAGPVSDDSALVAPLAEGAAAAEMREILEEIARWSSTALGQATVPLLWRILARNPHYLVATWRKETAVMGDGALQARDKRRVALGVAMAAGIRYMIEYNAAILRHAGDDDVDILEILGVVDHYTTLNTLSEGMQIDSDIRPT